jgi:metal-responsive CopG/Arc/MetJ family transcriptional regulator
MKKNSNQENYVTPKVPKTLADEIDRLIEAGTLGYRSRAEMVNDFIRHGIEELNANNSRGHNNFKQNRKE